MYLSKLIIENYRGIEKLELDFDPDINIIIGENGSNKSAVIDAIRILYNLGEPIKEITITTDDFFEKVSIDQGQQSVIKSTKISLTYIFRGLSSTQKGAFYEYMVITPGNTSDDHAKISIVYENVNTRHPQFSYNTGDIDGQRADYKTFELFQHYYLGALRDSTRDLLSSRANILGQVIKRHVERQESQPAIELIMKEANDKLLEREEVTKTRDDVNKNLEQIFKRYPDNKIGLQIEQSKAEYIVNAIKPFLPHDRTSLKDGGFHLWQNSLGFNNLIYIATVLGDINEQIQDDNTPHYALLIEEPEAHLHPQLQLSLYNFLKEASRSESSQLFITTHSPTLTSKVPFNNLILLDRKAFRISNLFDKRERERLIESTTTSAPLLEADFISRRKKLERYIDVTKSQLLFAKAILFVEGISEELLISAFTQLENYHLEDFRIELVNVDGTSFYPFMYLFNSSDEVLRIPKSITILTDDDRYSRSKEKEFSFERLIENSYSKLDELDTNIQNGTPTVRPANLNSVANGRANIMIKTAFKTFEYELALCNIPDNRTELSQGFLFTYLTTTLPEKSRSIIDYVNTFSSDSMSEEQRRKIALLLWKALPSKAEFAQDFSIHIMNNLTAASASLKVPPYILLGLDHLKQ